MEEISLKPMMKKYYAFVFFAFIWLFPALVTAQKGKSSLTDQQRLEFDKRFFSGMKEKMIKNNEDAASEFKMAILIDPGNANVHFQLASVLLPQKKNEEAILEAERAFNLDPSNEWYSKLLIELYKKDKQFDAGISVCELAYKTTKNAHYLYELSGLYVLLGKTSKAIQALDALEKSAGVNEELSRQKEDLYLAKNDIKGAIKEIKKLSDTYPDQLQYKGLLADLYMRSHQIDKGLEIYKRIQQKDSFNGFAAFSLADFYQQTRDTNLYFQQLCIGMKSSLPPKIKRQVLAEIIPSNDFGIWHREKCKQLVSLFEITNPSEPEPYLFKGDMALQDRKFEDARRQYLLSNDKSTALLTWEQIMFCDQQLQDYELMRNDAAKMMENFPDAPSGYLYHSIACRQLKEFELAFQSAKEGVNHATNEEILVQMLQNLGDMAHYAKHFALSDSAFEAAIAIEPNSSLALNNYAYFLSLRNIDLDKAESMSKRSIEIDPYNASNLDTYGWILFQKRKFKEAQIQIQKSLDLAPNNAEVLQHLGDVFFELGEVQKAMDTWKKALVLGGDVDALNYRIINNKLPLLK